MQSLAPQRFAPCGAPARAACFPLAFKPAIRSQGKCNKLSRHGQGRRALWAVRASETESGTADKPQVPAAGPAQNGSNGASSSGTGTSGSTTSSSKPRAASSLGTDGDDFSWQEFFNSDLPKKLGGLLALLLLSRVGVYIRLPGVDVDAFAESLTNSGLLGYIDTLSGGSISKVI